VNEWWSYRLRSFLLFSLRTYDRLIEDYNAQLWPLQAVLVAVAVAGLLALARQPSPARNRSVLAALAAAWCTVAWLFEHQRFAAINWAADYAALLFAVQALALSWAALRRGVALRVESALDRLALAVAALGVAVYPLLTAWLGRSWARAEVFALMPGPTALATVGCLLLAKPVRKRLLVVPLLVCGFEGALLWGLYLAAA
jgi:peptidoglycan/LPS O-acetylase OafA/YrhL